MPPTKKQGLALYLLADVLADKRKLERFIKRPRESAERYDLTDEKIAILYTLDPREIARMVSTEVRENVRRAVSGLWPFGEPFIDSFSPTELSSKQSKFRVVGEGLMWDAEIIFDPIGADGTLLVAKAKTTAGDFLATTLETTVRLVPGTYAIAVRNRPGSDLIRARKRLIVK
jgi:hypothetical protein